MNNYFNWLSVFVLLILLGDMQDLPSMILGNKR